VNMSIMETIDDLDIAELVVVSRTQQNIETNISLTNNVNDDTSVDHSVSMSNMDTASVNMSIMETIDDLDKAELVVVSRTQQNIETNISLTNNVNDDTSVDHSVSMSNMDIVSMTTESNVPSMHSGGFSITSSQLGRLMADSVSKASNFLSMKSDKQSTISGGLTISSSANKFRLDAETWSVSMDTASILQSMKEDKSSATEFEAVAKNCQQTSIPSDVVFQCGTNSDAVQIQELYEMFLVENRKALGTVQIKLNKFNPNVNEVRDSLIGLMGNGKTETMASHPLQIDMVGNVVIKCIKFKIVL
jgi:hypothetical protein